MAIEIKTPAFDDPDATAKAVEWLAEVGQALQTGDRVLEIETDKAVLAIEAPAAGVLSETLVGEGDTLASEQPVARMDPR